MKLAAQLRRAVFPTSVCRSSRPSWPRGKSRRYAAQDDPRYFQISVPVRPGNSGGALVDGRTDNVVLDFLLQSIKH